MSKNPRAATEVIKFRATPRERDTIRALALREGVTLSEWLREAVEARMDRTDDRTRFLRTRYEVTS